MVYRIKQLLELRRDIRRKKIDPLDKKRARDIHINLTEFKDIILKSPTSPNLERNIETSKSFYRSKKSETNYNNENPLEILGAVTSQRSGLEINRKISAADTLFPFDQFTDFPLETQFERKPSSPTWSGPFFRCKMLPGSTKIYTKNFYCNNKGKSLNGLKRGLSEEKFNLIWNHNYKADPPRRTNTRSNSPESRTKPASPARPQTMQVRNHKLTFVGGERQTTSGSNERKERGISPSLFSQRANQNRVSDHLDEFEKLFTKFDEQSIDIEKKSQSTKFNKKIVFTEGPSVRDSKRVQTANSPKDSGIPEKWAQNIRHLMTVRISDELVHQQTSQSLFKKKRVDTAA